MKNTTTGLASFALATFFFASMCLAQGAGQTTANPNVPLDHLDLLLDPLTREELEAEASAWRNLLKARVHEISTEEIATREFNQAISDAESISVVEEKEKTREASLAKLASLREQKSALIDRLDLVLKAWEKKGGDAGELRKYVTAVSGIKVEVTDTSATWSAMKGWLTSTEGGIKWVFKTLQFLLILIVFWVIAKMAGSLMQKITERSSKISGLLKTFLNKFVTRTILFVGFLVGVSTLGVNVGALLALVGGGAFILAFALQDTLGNFAAGMMLLLYRPFDVGDVVEVGGVLGIVDNVSLVNTTIRTFDNKEVLVPNNKVWGQIITNATANHTRRVDMVFGIGYGDDIDKAKNVIEKIVKSHELVLEQPAPVVQLHTLGESSVDFVCRPWTRTENYWQVYWDITASIKKEFDANDISIPFPQRDIHVYHENVES